MIASQKFLLRNIKLDKIFSLDKKVAIITGGLGQLGLEYTHALVQRGEKVAIFDMSDDKLFVSDKRFTPLLKKG